MTQSINQSINLRHSLILNSTGTNVGRMNLLSREVTAWMVFWLSTNWMAPLAPTVIEDAKSLRLGLTTEPQARIFVENSNPQNKEQLARAVENLEKIDRSKLQKAEALDVVIANDFQGLGRQKEAQERMAAALTKNPLLVSAYIDLFGMLCTAWNPTDAWQSYDLAKRINPDYERVKQIESMELKLEKDYPTLF